MGFPRGTRFGRVATHLHAVRGSGHKLRVPGPSLGKRVCRVLEGEGLTQRSMTHVESLRPSRSKVYRRNVAATNGLRRGLGLGVLSVLFLLPSCTSIDPGSDFVVPETTFDANYFYCHVEPGLIFAYSCGTGDPSKDKPSGCHFNASAVTGMALINHPAIDCGGGDLPVDLTQVGNGSPAQSNLGAVSLEMSKDYTTASVYVRPSNVTGDPPNAHPRVVFDKDDSTVNDLLRTWASK